MKKQKLKSILAVGIAFTLLTTSCNTFKKLTKEQKGAVVGATGGAAAGAAIGSKSKNPAVYAIVGSAIGGVAGAVVGKYMDKQAKEIEEDLGANAEVERIEEGIKVTMGSGILFGFDSYQLSANAKNNLTELSKTLDKYKDTEIMVGGHTDNVGTDSYNEALSEKRAKAVATYLSQKGVKRNRFVVMGFGEDKPEYDNDTEAGQMKNRRVELAIVADSKLKQEAKKEANDMASNK
ncbi:OmpA family protein [Arcticibacterium luteifluviistationis]|uniref:OmpA-like domain-containing protein n=1 Tax=Arcticibacterium luteifluviistationis TaxID=1784714 RepID=A0A2Z4GGT9_9BACT|nr:OmpA family protein [Arcticibacterium luteifluviistationis]AWW00402.1 hypothetical protein DJ013_20370 [Arcticibacterium luteifluviistationis]